MPTLKESDLTPLERLALAPAPAVEPLPDAEPEAPAAPVLEPPPAEGTLKSGLTEADRDRLREMGRAAWAQD